MDKVFTYSLHGIITAIIIMIGLMIIKHNQPPTLVKVDLVAVTTHYTEMMAKETLSDSTNDNHAVKKISNAIKANLEPILQNYSKKNKVIILQAQAIVDGDVPDITNNIVTELDKRIK